MTTRPPLSTDPYDVARHEAQRLRRQAMDAAWHNAAQTLRRWLGRPAQAKPAPARPPQAQTMSTRTMKGRSTCPTCT